MAVHEKQEPVFDLIKNMTKAEKRSFKLYATRLAGNQDAKFLSLFDHLDSVDDYDEARVLAKCPVKKEQLPNMKAHLYKQLLTSMRILNVQHSEIMQVREQLDFAQILFDKGLYRQSAKILDKIGEVAAALEEHGLLLDITKLREKIDIYILKKDLVASSDMASRRVTDVCRAVENITELSNTSVRVYSLYQKLGYARTQKDLDLIIQYFSPRLEAYRDRYHSMTFHEKFYFFQASAWYYYIQHDFLMSYRYSRLWVDLFDANPQMKEVLYDDYLRGCNQILEGLYLMLRHRRFAEYLDYCEKEFARIAMLNTNAHILATRILLTHKLNECFTKGEFTQGLELVEEVEEFISKYSRNLDIHHKMLFYYKIACLYFGDGNYSKCMSYLSRITSTKDAQIRRDLQCFARILNLIASYEAGIDYNLDYQIRSVYSFLVKMNDMNAVQKEMLGFLKKLNTIYADEIKDELKVLHERLKPYEDHPYERRAFYYLDIISWLESKITGKTVADVIKDKYRSRL